MEYYLDGLYDFRKLNLLAVRALPTAEILAKSSTAASEAVDIIRDLRLVDNMASFEARVTGTTGLLSLLSSFMVWRYGEVKSEPDLGPIAALYHEVSDLVAYLYV